MNHRDLIISAFCFICTVLYSDTWTQTYDPYPNLDLWNVEDVIECSDGGFAVNGTYVDNDYIYWGFVLKTDSEGNFEWAEKDTVSFQNWNESRAITSTNDGGILTASYLSVGNTAMIKRDLNGNREWAEPLYDIYVHSMDETADNNIITAGSTFYNNEQWPALAKINENAEVMWSQTYEFNSYEWGVIKSVIQSSDGGYLLTGTVRDSETEDVILAIKTNANGDSLWSRVYDATELDDKGKTIVETTENDILVGGFLESLSGFIWKLDPLGNTVWFETPQEGQSSFAVAIDESIISVSVWGDHYINKFDSNYNVIWQRDFPYYYGYGDKSFCITSSENIIVSIYDYPNVGLIKLNPDGTDIDSNEVIEAITNLKAYPNPFNPNCHLSFSLDRESEVTINIYNIKGQIVSEFNKGKLSIGYHSVLWDANGFASGIYMMQLIVNNNIVDTKKVSLIK